MCLLIGTGSQLSDVAHGALVLIYLVMYKHRHLYLLLWNQVLKFSY